MFSCSLDYNRFTATGRRPKPPVRGSWEAPGLGMRAAGIRDELNAKETMMTNFLTIDDAEWKERLDEDSYRVLREAGTERPGTGALLDEGRAGEYSCKACGQVLFDAETKFDAGCGWPSFYEAKDGSVNYIDDHSLGMHRVEVRCSGCDSHLGHIFPDAPYTPTGNRFCMNSLALRFTPEGGQAIDG